MNVKVGYSTNTKKEHVESCSEPFSNNQYEKVKQANNIMTTKVVIVNKGIPAIIKQELGETCDQIFSRDNLHSVKRKCFLPSRIGNGGDNVPTIVKEEFVETHDKQYITEQLLEFDQDCNISSGNMNLNRDIVSVAENHMESQQVDTGVVQNPLLASVCPQVKSLKLELIEKNFVINSLLLSKCRMVTDLNNDNLSAETCTQLGDNSPQDSSCELDVIDDLIKMNLPRQLEDGCHLNGNEELVGDFNTIISDVKKWPEETVLLAGDSILNNINQDKLSKKYNIKRVAFPGTCIDEMASQLTLLLAKKPRYILLHVDTNVHGCPRKLADVLKDLVQLRVHIEKCLPTACVILCCPTISTDDVKYGTNIKGTTLQEDSIKVNLIDCHKNQELTLIDLESRSLHI